MYTRKSSNVTLPAVWRVPEGYLTLQLDNQSDMFDIFFLSYDEPNREPNWRKLKARFPRARHIHGIKGIWKAHKACADQANTESFFVVDGDSEVLDSFDFRIATTRVLDKCIFVWHAFNPVLADTARTRFLGQNARRKVQERFDIRRNTEHYIRLFERISGTVEEPKPMRKLV